MGAIRKVFSVVAAPFRMVLAVARFLRALLTILIFALLVLLVACLFSSAIRSCVLEHVFSGTSSI